MNNEFISDAINDIDEQFIVEAREDNIKPIRHIRPRFIVPIAACACACAVALCVCLPMAFSHGNGPTVPSTVGTENPPYTPPTGTDTPNGPESNDPPNNPSENNPPITGTDDPPSVGDGDTKPYFEYGYTFNGATEPVSRFMIAYRIERTLDRDADCVSVTLSFGEYMHQNVGDWGMTHVVVSVYDPSTEQSYELKNLTYEQFAAPEYDVKIKCTIEENEYGELVTTSETRTFGHEETFTFPSAMFGNEYGTLVFNIFAFNGDEYISGSGVDICYAKTGEKINIISYREYKDIEQSHQTPPKTDITIKPAA